MIEFGQRATGLRLTQKEAMDTARSVELYGLGGTNDGIIGALAAVGLTRHGWCGRFIEYGRLRDLPPLHARPRPLHRRHLRGVSGPRPPWYPCRATPSWTRPGFAPLSGTAGQYCR